MTTRTTLRAVALAIACAWLAVAFPAADAAAAPAAASVPAAASAAQSASAGSAAAQYTVKPGQSLADIAAAVTQSHDKFVVGRASKAIFDANPSAFSHNNPSLLKLGAVLNVPPLDATGALVGGEPASAAAAGGPASAPSAAAAAPQVTASGAKASGVQAAKPVSAPAAAVTPAPASAAVAAKSGTGASNAAAAAAHPQPSVPATAAGGEHAWSGAIQPAPTAQVLGSAAAGAGASGAAASAATAASAPVGAASESAASGATPIASASQAAATSASGAAATASSVAAPAAAASHPKVSSLQQLLALKNRVLMELQQHGFGAPSAGRTSGAASSAPAAASGFMAPPPALGAAHAVAPTLSRGAAAANQRFIGIGGFGFSLAGNAIPTVAAIAAAIVAALLVLLGALGIGRRKRRAAPPAAGADKGTAAGAPRAVENAEPSAAAAPSSSGDDPIEAEFVAILARTPSSKRALMGLAAHYAQRGNVRGFDEIAQRIYRLSGGRGPNWLHVASLGRQLDPNNPLYALEAGETDAVDEAASMSAPETDVSPEAGHAAGPGEAPAQAELAPASAGDAAPEPVADEAPELKPAVEPAPIAEPLHESDLSHATAQHEAESEPAQPTQAASSEAATEPEAETEPAREPAATLPPEAVAALGELDMGLPPRVEPAIEPAGQATSAQAGTVDEEEAAQPYADAQPQPHIEPQSHATPAEHAASSEHAAHEPAAAASVPPARPGVAGLGAAPIGSLDLSFDLDLPGTGEGASERAPAAAMAPPLPQFTPEQLVKIARNKLDLASEYIALGDLGGARTLIHEVIESNDAATREEAHALLATLAPLS